MALFYVPFAVFILYLFNSLTYALCLKSEMSTEKSHKVFRTVNVSITILLISSYIEVMYT